MPRSNPHSPRTKRELRDKILSYGVGLDFRTLSPDPGNVKVTPIGSTTIGLDFPDTGHFELVTRRPRGTIDMTKGIVAQTKAKTPAKRSAKRRGRQAR